MNGYVYIIRCMFRGVVCANYMHRCLSFVFKLIKLVQTNILFAAIHMVSVNDI